MPKLNLKETKSEKEEKEWRRARREARKSVRHKRYSDDEGPSAHTSSKSFGRSKKSNGYQDLHSDLDEGHWSPPSTSYKQQTVDDDEEFRQKLFDAMEQDHGQDSAQARFNEYVPSRWRDHIGDSFSGGPQMGGLDAKDARPELMDDDEYAEWIRYGMWARKHKAEHDEKLRKEAERKERKEKEARLREETKKLEREEAERRKKRREEKQTKLLLQYWKEYEDRWATLRQSTTTDGDLDFRAIPWPVFPSPDAPSAITKSSVSEFLLSSLHSSGKSKKQRLREGLLLFHPDRFEGRFLARVKAQDQLVVKEAVGRTARALNELVEEHQDS
ncbi:hypothetical protein FRC02_010329 [Tulasnella sp. 418]|nr:hypothetical protein FRC02_010329 [Tulasnella sp. 418]